MEVVVAVHEKCITVSRNKMRVSITLANFLTG